MSKGVTMFDRYSDLESRIEEAGAADDLVKGEITGPLLWTVLSGTR